MHTIFGADVTVFHYPKHAVAQRGWRKATKPTVGFKSLARWTPTEHNVAFAERATGMYGQPYGQFMAGMRKGYGYRKSEADYRAERDMKHAAARDSIAAMRDAVARTRGGRFAAGRGYGMGRPEEVPEWYRGGF